MSGAMPPLPIWFAEGQFKFNFIGEIKHATGKAGYGRRRQQANPEDLVATLRN
jgi:hypothetical protein